MSRPKTCHSPNYLTVANTYVAARAFWSGVTLMQGHLIPSQETGERETSFSYSYCPSLEWFSLILDNVTAALTKNTSSLSLLHYFSSVCLFASVAYTHL